MKKKIKHQAVVVVPKLLQEQLTHMFPAHRFQCYCTEQSTQLNKEWTLSL